MAPVFRRAVSGYDPGPLIIQGQVVNLPLCRGRRRVFTRGAVCLGEVSLAHAVESTGKVFLRPLTAHNCWDLLGSGLVEGGESGYKLHGGLLLPLSVVCFVGCLTRGSL